MFKAPELTGSPTSNPPPCRRIILVGVGTHGCSIVQQVLANLEASPDASELLGIVLLDECHRAGELKRTRGLRIGHWISSPDWDRDPLELCEAPDPDCDLGGWPEEIDRVAQSLRDQAAGDQADIFYISSQTYRKPSLILTASQRLHQGLTDQDIETWQPPDPPAWLALPLLKALLQPSNFPAINGKGRQNGASPPPLLNVN